MRSRLTSIVFSLGMLTFLLMGLVGVYHMSMVMGDDGKMDDCPFAFGGVICTMTPLDHVNIVRSLLITLPQHKDVLANLVFFVSAVFFFGIFLVRVFAPPKLSLAYNRAFTREYMPLGDFLQEAFSGGILHTKVF